MIKKTKESKIFVEKLTKYLEAGETCFHDDVLQSIYIDLDKNEIDLEIQMLNWTPEVKNPTHYKSSLGQLINLKLYLLNPVFQINTNGTISMEILWINLYNKNKIKRFILTGINVSLSCNISKFTIGLCEQEFAKAPIPYPLITRISHSNEKNLCSDCIYNNPSCKNRSMYSWSITIKCSQHTEQKHPKRIIKL